MLLTNPFLKSDAAEIEGDARGEEFILINLPLFA